MKKKGFIGDATTYVLALFILSIVFVSFYYVVTQINIGWQAGNMPSVSNTIMSDFKNSFVSVYDNVFAFLVIGFLIVIVLLAYLLRSTPAFAWLAIIILIIMGVVAVYLSNAYFDFSQSAGIATVSTEFTKLNFLATKLPHIIIIFGTIFVIVLYAKSNNQGVGL